MALHRPGMWNQRPRNLRFEWQRRQRQGSSLPEDAARSRFFLLTRYVAPGRPAVPQEISRHLGLAISGENALLVAVYTVQPLLGLKIRKGPHLLADDKVRRIEHLVICFEKFALEFLREGDWGSL